MQLPVLSTTIFSLMLVYNPVEAATRHVPEEYPSIQAAIDAAAIGDEVIVAPGTYYENINCLGKAITVRSSGGAEVTTIDGREIDRAIKWSNNEDRTTVLDGFAVTGRKGGAMVWRSAPTIRNCLFRQCQGEWGGAIYCEAGSPLIEDCTFIANISSADGGAIHAWSPAIPCAPHIRRCLFSDNMASPNHRGGALKLHDAANVVTLENCAFSGNSAGVDGGAIAFNFSNIATLTDCWFGQNNASFGGAAYVLSQSDVTLVRCIFDGNEATGTHDGGGAAAVRDAGSRLILEQCEFRNNATFNSGGAIFSCCGGTLHALGSMFLGNTAYAGGAVCSSEKASSLFEDCTFSSNRATSDGGAALADNSGPQFQRCLFDSNTAGGSAGAIKCWSWSPDITTITESTFVGNSCRSLGGAIKSIGAPHLEVLDCLLEENQSGEGGAIDLENPFFCADSIFENNSAERGGAVRGRWTDGGVVFQDCILDGNYANYDGGAVSFGSLSNVSFSGCVVSRNTSDGGPGGISMYLPGGQNVIVDTTIVANVGAGGCAAGICFSGGTLSITNGIIYGNHSTDGTLSNMTGPVSVTYGDVQGGWPGMGNIDADPLFVDAPGGDYRLGATSPCIDAGDNTAVPEELTTDLAGQPRFVDDPDTADTGVGTPPIVDMGAFEFQPNSFELRDTWPMKHRDMHHTGRSDYIIPASRMNDSFFDTFLWQKPSPHSPGEGNLDSGSLVFFDGAGPGGADLVVGVYHWPKGVQGMNRHTGQTYWYGLPRGGELIARYTPAFSPDGSVIYVLNDATESTEWPSGHPLMAFHSTVGPSVYWHNGTDSVPYSLSSGNPTIDPSGRIFVHRWVDRPYAGKDLGDRLSCIWAAATWTDSGLSDPTLWENNGKCMVFSGGRFGVVIAHDGMTGDELWSKPTPYIDATGTVDPTTGNIYFPAGRDSIWEIGLTFAGDPLWPSGAASRLFEWIPNINSPQRAQAAGALSHDGATFYFQSSSLTGEGQLYAVNTADGSLKWTYPTGSLGWEQYSASPTVTPNNVIVIGNNEGRTYFALRDAETSAELLDTLVVDAAGNASATPSISADGVLYLPLRTLWTMGNGDGEAPTFSVQNLFTAINLGDGSHTVALRIEPNPIAVRLGFPQEPRAIATAGGVDVDVTESATWQSDDASVASIDATGRVRGEVVGQTTITATYESLLAEATVDVLALPEKLKTEMISLTPSGAPGGGDSYFTRTAVSRDGQHLAFVSRASDLVDPPTDGESNIFVRDLRTGQTHRVSLAFDGGNPNGASDFPTLSATGRFVCFDSNASNILATGEDANAVGDVFVADRDADGNSVFDEPGTLVVTRVSVGSGGMESPAGGNSGSISADGSRVVFHTTASLHPNDTNGHFDVYVHDRLARSTAWVSQTESDQAANGASFYASISADSRFVGFISFATDLGPDDQNGYSDAYIIDRDTDGNGIYDEPGTRSVERISVSYTGMESDGYSGPAYISDAGDVVTFLSDATNLVPGDFVDAYTDAFAWSRATGQVTRVNRTPSGAYSTGDTIGSLIICPNGRFIGFRSAAADMCGPEGAATGGFVFRYDLWTGRTDTMSLDPFGGEPNGVSGWIAFSYDGRVISFVSKADNLAPFDLNGVGDVFVRYDWAGDLDGDGVVDIADYTAFADCLSGPGIPTPDGCAFFDRDGDGDIDLAEFAEMQRDFTGELP